jgi:flagellar biosynthesis protein FlhG
MAFRQLAEEMLSWASAEAPLGSDASPSRLERSEQDPAQDPVSAPAQATSYPTPSAAVRAAEMVY